MYYGQFGERERETFDGVEHPNQFPKQFTLRSL